MRLPFFTGPPRLLLFFWDSNVPADKAQRLQEALVLGDALPAVALVLGLDGRHIVECGFPLLLLGPLRRAAFSSSCLGLSFDLRVRSVAIAAAG